VGRTPSSAARPVAGLGVLIGATRGSAAGPGTRPTRTLPYINHETGLVGQAILALLSLDHAHCPLDHAHWSVR